MRLLSSIIQLSFKLSKLYMHRQIELQDKINFEAQLRKNTILATHDSQRKRLGREMLQYNIDNLVSSVLSCLRISFVEQSLKQNAARSVFLVSATLPLHGIVLRAVASFISRQIPSPEIECEIRVGQRDLGGLKAGAIVGLRSKFEQSADNVGQYFGRRSI